MEKNYWLDLFSPETWEEVSKIGYTITGFRRSRWNSLSRVRKGDILICYLTKYSRFCGLLEVSSEPFLDDSPIWKSDPFPSRVKTVPLVTLQPSFSIPFDVLVQYFQSATSWRGYVRGSPMKLPSKDGVAIESALLNAARIPKEYPLKLKHYTFLRSVSNIDSPLLDEKAPLLSVPLPEPQVESVPEAAGGITADAIQLILVKLGLGMRLSVWVGRDSRNKIVDGVNFAQVCLEALPTQFDQSTTRIIEYIDVLWLDGNAIVAAFEIEHTTSIYSGLLRMSDLVSMQPNINIPLYIVADDDRREKVRQEINRPTFRMLRKPMVDICRFIAYGRLINFFKEKKDDLPFTHHEIIREKLSEICSM
jgi:hypothetical protein